MDLAQALSRLESLDHSKQIPESVQKAKKPDLKLGDKFGRWTIQGPAKRYENSPTIGRYFPVKCDCGNLGRVKKFHLVNERSTQCSSCQSKNAQNIAYPEIIVDNEQFAYKSRSVDWTGMINSLQEKGFPLAKIAEWCSVSSGTIWAWQNKRRKPSREEGASALVLAATATVGTEEVLGFGVERVSV